MQQKKKYSGFHGHNDIAGCKMQQSHNAHGVNVIWNIALILFRDVH